MLACVPHKTVRDKRASPLWDKRNSLSDKCLPWKIPSYCSMGSLGNSRGSPRMPSWMWDKHVMMPPSLILCQVYISVDYKKKKYRKKEGFSKVTLHRHKANFKGSEKILRILIGSQILIHEVLKDS